MKFTYKRYLLGLFLLTVILLLLLSGCGVFQKKQPPSPAENKQETAPEELKKMEGTIEVLFTNLGGPTTMTEQGQDQQGQGGQSKDQQGQGGQSKDQQGQSSQSTDPKAQASKQEQEQGDQAQGTTQDAQKKEERKPSDPWQTMAVPTKALHFAWNDFLPSLAARGASKEMMDQFGSDLNDFSNGLSKKDKATSLLQLNRCYGSLVDFYAIYGPHSAISLKRMTYHAREVMLRAQTGEWEKAESQLEALQETWDLAKNTLEDKQKEDASKLTLSVLELKKALPEKNKNLVQIKGEITLSNLQTLAQKLEKESKSG